VDSPISLVWITEILGTQMTVVCMICFRTKVYSGVKSGKSWSSAPSLYDICVRVLQENIDGKSKTFIILKALSESKTSCKIK
jgi:hypothetical protein